MSNGQYDAGAIVSVSIPDSKRKAFHDALKVLQAASGQTFVSKSSLVVDAVIAQAAKVEQQVK